jgi:hypothetical protein
MRRSSQGKTKTTKTKTLPYRSQELGQTDGVRPISSWITANFTGRLALWGLVGSLLIPLGTTTLRGMHHLVSCVDEIDQTFAVTAIDAKRAIVTGSTVIMREPPVGDCASVDMAMRVRPDGKGFIAIRMPVVNETDRAWTTSVILQLDGLRTSVPMGVVQPGETVTKITRVRLRSDLKSITGTLVVGP